MQVQFLRCRGRASLVAQVAMKELKVITALSLVERAYLRDDTVCGTVGDELWIAPVDVCDQAVEVIGESVAVPVRGVAAIACIEGSWLVSAVVEGQVCLLEGEEDILEGVEALGNAEASAMRLAKGVQMV